MTKDGYDKSKENHRRGAKSTRIYRGMTYVSWSGGKDSTATIILAHEQGLKIDKILFSEVMFDKKNGISGELTEHIDFIKNKCIPLFNTWGYEVEILHSEKDFLDNFYAEIGRGDRKGKLHGFPIAGKCIINDRCKIAPIRKYYKQFKNDQITQYVGIAIDEPKRLNRLEGTNKVSLLAENGITEEMAYRLCEKYGLLSPVYEFTKRGGCWFCPNQKISELARLRKAYPSYWKTLLDLGKTSNLCSYGFKYGKTVEEIDKQITKYEKDLEDEKDQITLNDILGEINERD